MAIGKFENDEVKLKYQNALMAEVKGFKIVKWREE